MEARVNYAAVGAFVIVLAAAMIGGILWLSAGMHRADYQFYVAYVTESVSGLNVNAPVKYRGVDVGVVREIGLRPGNPEQVRLLMAIERYTPVKEDTVAILSVQGLTGIAFIDLTGGSQHSPLLEARRGEAYPVIQTGPSLLARLDTAASQMFTNIERVSDALSALVDEQNQVAFREALQSIRAFTARLEQVLNEENSQQLEESLAALHQVSTALAGNAGSIEEMIQNLHAASEGLPTAVDNFTDAGAKFTETMDATQAEIRYLSQQITPQAAAVLTDLRRASASLERFADNLENDPALLLHGPRERSRGPGER
ncbi:MAG: MlaD family protein [Gammaproteobacteria bacterium]